MSQMTLIGLMFMALVTGCGGDGVRVLVSAGALPQQAMGLRAAVKLDGRRLQGAESIKPGDAQVILQLAGGTQGQLAITLDAVTQGGCSVARGTGAVKLDGGAWFNLPVTLTPLMPPDCTGVLNVQVLGQGAGSVVSNPMGLLL